MDDVGQPTAEECAFAEAGGDGEIGDGRSRLKVRIETDLDHRKHAPWLEHAEQLGEPERLGDWLS